MTHWKYPKADKATIINCPCRSDWSGARIHFCPLHKAAPEMYKLLLEVADTFYMTLGTDEYKEKMDSLAYRVGKLLGEILKGE